MLDMQTHMYVYISFQMLACDYILYVYTYLYQQIILVCNSPCVRLDKLALNVHTWIVCVDTLHLYIAAGI